MKVFVTGGTGFVGSHLVQALLERGDDVVCLARNPTKVDRLFTGKKPRVVLGDLENREAMLQGVRGADVVFHVAGLIAARSGAEFFAANAAGTRLLAEATTHVAPLLKRFVYVSSLAAAGPSRRGTPLTETDVAKPITLYGSSKRAGEEALSTFDFPWTAIRPPVVYGPRDTEMFRVFKLGALGLGAVFGDGTQELSFIYVEDLVSALLHAADRAGPRSTYFAAHPEVVTTRELVTRVHRAVRGLSNSTGSEKAEPFVLPIPGALARGGLWLTEKAAALTGKATLLTRDKANEFLAEAFVCSPAALTRDTGWQPQWDLAKGLPRTAAWYRSEGWL